MTCRHAPGDPNCSSTRGGYADMERQREREAELRASTPDADNYQIVGIQRIGFNLVLKVKYPSCSKCEYEGQKVMVFLNVPEDQAMMWRRIDPHFRDPKRNRMNEAPGPAARFPATEEGWKDAVAYATRKFSEAGGNKR